MSRSVKRGLDYFSVDVGLLSDRKVRRVLHACGAQAMAVVMSVWCCAYQENGYYAAADDDFYFDIASSLNMDEAYARGVVEKCLEAGLFDRGLYERFAILTSRRMQSNFLDATKKRRVKKTIEEQYLLVTEQECDPQNGECVAQSSKCAPQNGECVPQSTQSKVKQSKEEQSKAQHDGARGGVLSFGDCVSMTEDEYASLKKQFGEQGAKRMTEMLGNYKASTGKAYLSDYHAILSWVVRRWREDGGNTFERPTENYDHLAIDPFKDDG